MIPGSVLPAGGGGPRRAGPPTGIGARIPGSAASSIRGRSAAGGSSSAGASSSCSERAVQHQPGSTFQHRPRGSTPTSQAESSPTTSDMGYLPGLDREQQRQPPAPRRLPPLLRLAPAVELENDLGKLDRVAAKHQKKCGMTTYSSPVGPVAGGGAAHDNYSSPVGPVAGGDAAHDNFLAPSRVLADRGVRFGGPAGNLVVWGELLLEQDPNRSSSSVISRGNPIAGGEIMLEEDPRAGIRTDAARMGGARAEARPDARTAAPQTDARTGRGNGGWGGRWW